MSDPSPGWYEDPKTPGRARFWDGHAWGPEMVEVGWHDDPEHPGRRRYWDGTWWSDKAPEEARTHPAVRRRRIRMLVRPSSAGRTPDDLVGKKLAAVGVTVVALVLAGIGGVILGKATWNSSTPSTTINPSAFGGATTIPGTALVKEPAGGAQACAQLGQIIDGLKQVLIISPPPGAGNTITASDYYLNYTVKTGPIAARELSVIGEYSSRVSYISPANELAFSQARIALGGLIYDLNEINAIAGNISGGSDQGALSKVLSLSEKANSAIDALARARAVATSLHYTCAP